MSESNRPTVVLAMAESHMPLMMPEPTLTELRAFAKVVMLTRPADLTAEGLAAALTDADGVITCWGTPTITPDMLARAPRLKVIAHSAGSIRPVVCREAVERGITVTQGAYHIGYAVAETTLALILAGLKLTWLMDRQVQATRDWKAIPRPVEQLWELRGLTVGVVALSQVGQQVIPLLKSFGCTVIAYDPFAPAAVFDELDVEKVELAELFDRADVVTLHLPVTDETKGMITGDLLARLKDHALVVNTSRGAVIDEPALVAELTTGRLRAGLDVTEPEPPSPDSPLYGLDNVLLTPHIAGHGVQTRRRQGEQAVADVRTVLIDGGTPPRPITLANWDRMA